jgi:hypothetical protein
VFFMMEEERAVVLAIMHLRRHPRAWSGARIETETPRVDRRHLPGRRPIWLWADQQERLLKIDRTPARVLSPGSPTLCSPKMRASRETAAPFDNAHGVPSSVEGGRSGRRPRPASPALTHDAALLAPADNRYSCSARPALSSRPCAELRSSRSASSCCGS